MPLRSMQQYPSIPLTVQQVPHSPLMSTRDNVINNRNHIWTDVRNGPWTEEGISKSEKVTRIALSILSLMISVFLCPFSWFFFHAFYPRNSGRQSFFQRPRVASYVTGCNAGLMLVAFFLVFAMIFRTIAIKFGLDHHYSEAVWDWVAVFSPCLAPETSDDCWNLVLKVKGFGNIQKE